MVLDIEMSEFVSNEVAIVHEQSSQDVRGAVRYPQSCAGPVSDPRLCPDDEERGVARNPLSGTDLVNDQPLRAPEGRHGVARYSPSGVSRVNDSPLRGRRGTIDRRVMDRMALSCVSRETRPPRLGLLVLSHLGAATVMSPRGPHPAGLGEVDGDISLDSLSAVNALLELDEMSIAEFGEALKAGDLAEVVVVRPEEALSSSSVVDEAVLEDNKKALSARCGSEILKDPSDPFYPVLQEYTDVVSKIPPMGLPPDRGVCHEIVLVPGIKYCVTRQRPLPKEQCDVIDAFFRAKHEAGLVRESKSPDSTPTFCVRKPSGKWRIVHTFNKLNTATIPVQTPIPRKDVLQTTCGEHSERDALGVAAGAVKRTSNVQSSCDAVVPAA
ncbi:hypothetical protein C6341_g939 [Phytophthora cactorum]|nr:hypothetical protein C6341_g939 [Phytophthora cactorum]